MENHQSQFIRHEKYLQLIIAQNLVEENITTALTRSLPETGLAFWVIQTKRSFFLADFFADFFQREPTYYGHCIGLQKYPSCETIPSRKLRRTMRKYRSRIPVRERALYLREHRTLIITIFSLLYKQYFFLPISFSISARISNIFYRFQEYLDQIPPYTPLTQYTLVSRTLSPCSFPP